MFKLTPRGTAAALLPLLAACATAKSAATPEPGTGTATAASATASTAATSTASTPPATAPAHDMSSHAGHGGMNMSMPITIPPGVIYTKADVEFMQGMIAHHAQAIAMSQLAETRGVNTRVLRFAKKIDQSQRAEIRLMQEWLVENKQFAPDTNSHKSMMMVGMLTPEQMKMLESTKGPEFDRQFLTLMIKHHQGALQMVKDLFASPRAAQDVDVNVFANEVENVQTVEIQLMQQMLADL